MKFSIFDCENGKRISDESYATAEQANHDYHMNAGHTCVKPIEEVMNCPHCDEPIPPELVRAAANKAAASAPRPGNAGNKRNPFGRKGKPKP